MKRIITLSLLLATFSLSIGAQTLTSGYFLEGNLQRSQLNPAFQGEHQYLAFPALSNVNVGLNGNVGLGNFLYPYNQNGQALTTYLSGTVDAESFLNSLPERARLEEQLDMTLLAIGTRKGENYNTFTVSLHENAAVFVPKTFFELTKLGLQQESYSFSGLGAKARAYADVAFAHSHTITENLKVGGRAHLLIGFADASVTLDKLNMTMNENRWMAEAQATGRAALFGTSVLTLDEKGFPDGVEFKPALTSWGAGLDLGAEYNMGDLVEGLSLSAALADLGFFQWKSSYLVGSHEGTFEYTGLGEIDPEHMDLDEQLSKIGEDALDLMNLYFQPNEERRTSLSPLFRLGADYKMPFWNKMSASVLYTQRFDEMTPFADGRVFLNIAPLEFLELSANVGVSTFGTEFGWMVNLHPKGLQLFMGSDFLVSKLSPQFIPLDDFNANFCMGLNIAF